MLYTEIIEHEVSLYISPNFFMFFMIEMSALPWFSLLIFFYSVGLVTVTFALA
jgi:hypothetical protein